jgi:pilus assembly protein Flp/PilA
MYFRSIHCICERIMADFHLQFPGFISSLPHVTDVVIGCVDNSCSYFRPSSQQLNRPKRRNIMTNTMRNISSVFCSFLSDESGQDLIEYALVAAIIALGAVTAMTTLATTIASAFTTVGTKLTTAL